jgi:hypothetical protein
MKRPAPAKIRGGNGSIAARAGKFNPVSLSGSRGCGDSARGVAFDLRMPLTRDYGDSEHATREKERPSDGEANSLADRHAQGFVDAYK